MNALSPKERVIAALEKEELDRPPISIFTQSSTHSQMNRVCASYPDAHTNSGLMAKLGSAQADLYGFESVRVPFCLTVEAERFGCFVDLGTNETSPVVRQRPFNLNPYTGECIGSENLSIEPDEFTSSGRTAVVIEAISTLSKTHGKTHPVIAGATGPLTTLGQIFGVESIIMSSLICPDLVAGLIDSVLPCFRRYVQTLSDNGADIITMAEGLISPDVMDPNTFDELGKNYLDCLTSVKDSYSVLHTCGDVSAILGKMESVGASAISIESAVDPYFAAASVKNETVLVGNIGTIFPLMLGTPEDVRLDAAKCINAGFDIIAPGCGVPLSTPDENLEALVHEIVHITSH